MSPEQARGERVDARSDLFSFGVVLYEMATGVLPFRGATSAVVFHEILSGTPARPLQLNPDAAADLERMITKALEKDRDIRYQSAAEMRADLKRMRRDQDSSRSAGAAVVTSTSSGPKRGWRRQALVAAVVLTLVLSVAMYVVWSGPSSPKTETPSRDFEISQLTSSGNAVAPAISPDGRYVVYVQRDSDNTSLWVRQVATSSNVKIVNVPLAGYLVPSVTPDGSYVDYNTFAPTLGAAGPTAPQLWRVPFLGGTPKKVLDNVWTRPGWSPDGRQMAFIRVDVAADTDSLVIADADGGNQRVLSTRRRPKNGFISAFSVVFGTAPRPACSPDGRTIALFGFDAAATRIEVVFVDVATGAETARPAQGGFVPAGIAWLSPTALLLSQPKVSGFREQLWRMSYPDGLVTPVTNDLSRYSRVDVDAAPAASSPPVPRREWASGLETSRAAAANRSAVSLYGDADVAAVGGRPCAV